MDRNLMPLLSHSKTFESLRMIQQNLENHALLGSLEEVTTQSFKLEKIPAPAEARRVSKTKEKGYSDQDLVQALMKLSKNRAFISRSSILKGSPQR